MIMFILKKIREFCFNFSTLFGMGEWSFASLIAALLSLPLLLLTRLIKNIIPLNYFNYSLAFLFFLYLVIIFLALGFITEKDKSTIIINKTVGMFFVFWGIPLRIKFVVTGFILFHILSFFAPFIFYKIFNKRIESLPVHLGPMAGDILYGIACNLFLQFLIWFAR